MVAERSARPPQLVQFARQSAGGADDDVRLLARAHERAEHFGVGRRRRVGRRDVAGGGRFPFGLGLRGFVAPGARRLPGVELGIERGERRPGVADDRQSLMFGRIEGLDVDADQSPIRVLEQSPGAGGEVGEPRADADDHVGLRGERVGRAGPGDADRAHGQRMIDRRRRLAGLRLADRNSALGAEVDQLPLGVGIKDAAAADDERLLRLSSRSPPLPRSRADRARCGAGDARVRRRSSLDSHRPRSARPGRRRASPARIRPDRSGPTIARLSAGTICSGRVMRSK